MPGRLEDMVARKYVAVFVNGSLMCPDQPDDDGDYNLTDSEIEFHNDNIGPQDLVQITDFEHFRWIYQGGHWHKL